MKINSFFRYTGTVLLIALACSSLAFCGQIHDTASNVRSSTNSPVGQQQAPKTSPQIIYSLTSDNASKLDCSALVATVNGKRRMLISKSEGKCLEIVNVRDFDGDGSPDALVKDIIACGGNSTPNGFFFVSALPDGSFAVTDSFADSWDDPVIAKWKGQWSVVVISNNEGFNLDRPVEFTRRFVLERGKALKVEEHKRQDMKALAEMRSEIFHINKNANSPEETHALQYDLEGVGKKDTITGRLWDRWGRIIWTVQFANGKTFSGNDACKRIGVLPTKTKGVHDLVCDQDEVLRWNGSEYKK